MYKDVLIIIIIITTPKGDQATISHSKVNSNTTINLNHANLHTSCQSIQANNGTKETDNGLCHEHSSITVETHSTNRTRIQHAPLTEENTCTNEYIASQELPPNPRLPPKQVDKRVPQRYAGKVSQFPKYTGNTDKGNNDNAKRHKPSQPELTNCCAIPTRVTHRNRAPSKKLTWRRNKHGARINQTEEGFRKDKWKANMRFFQYYY